MQRLSRRAAAISPAPTLAIAAKAKRMAAKGIDVISFSTGEPDFDTPTLIADAGIDAIRGGKTHYTDARGTPALRQAVASMFQREHGIESDPERVLVSAGGKQSIFYLLASILDPGDEVVLQAPYWVSYPSMISINDGTPVVVETSVAAGFKMSASDLENAMTEQTKCIILNSPSNPTGAMYTEGEIRAFVEIARNHDCFLLSDELYARIIYGEVSHYSPASDATAADRILTVNGVSKSWAMTGWRIGFATGPADVIAAAGAIQSQVASNPCSISQAAAVTAIEQGDEEAERLRQAFEVRRTLMAEGLGRIDDVQWTMPDGAFYFFVDISRYFGPQFRDGLAIADSLLEEEALAFVPGIAFGEPSGIRLSYACSNEDIVRGTERLARGLGRIAAANGTGA